MCVNACMPVSCSIRLAADNFPREKQFGSFLLSPVAVLMALGCQVNARKPPPPESGGHMQTTTQKLAALFPALEQFTTFHLKMRLILFLLRAFKHASHQRHVSLLNTHSLIYVYAPMGWNLCWVKNECQEKRFLQPAQRAICPWALYNVVWELLLLIFLERFSSLGATSPNHSH
jgi:hypothetical protein